MNIMIVGMVFIRGGSAEDRFDIMLVYDKKSIGSNEGLVQQLESQELNILFSYFAILPNAELW